MKIKKYIVKIMLNSNYMYFSKGGNLYSSCVFRIKVRFI